jgi:hypothetical protein
MIQISMPYLARTMSTAVLLSGLSSCAKSPVPLPEPRTMQADLDHVMAVMGPEAPNDRSQEAAAALATIFRRAEPALRGVAAAREDATTTCTAVGCYRDQMIPGLEPLQRVDDLVFRNPDAGPSPWNGTLYRSGLFAKAGHPGQLFVRWVVFTGKPVLQ